MRTINVDTAIIGGGPAGATAAIQLARAGKHVVLIEKYRFPREKACGGCLSGSATEHLRTLLGPDAPMPGVPGRQISFHFGSYKLQSNPQATTRIVSRAAFDADLLNMAADAGTEIWFGQTASMERNNAGWEVVVGERRVRARAILIAAGVARRPRGFHINGRYSGIGMIAQQWVQPGAFPLRDSGEVELHWLRGGYIGLATPQADKCVVALVAWAPGSSDESAFDRLVRLNPGARIMQILGPDAAERHKARGMAGFPWIPERLGDGNALLIGDAAGYAEPFTGEGIGQAMDSASCAVEAIAAGDGILRTYTALMRGRHRQNLWRTRALGSMLRFRPFGFFVSNFPFLPESTLQRLVTYIHVGSAG